MNSSFILIEDLVNFLAPLNAEWFVSGGWAIDLYLNRITRKRSDLDVSVPFSNRFACIDFFLEKDWQIEGKLFDGFKTLHKLSDYLDDIYYFWSFPKDADFVSEYIDSRGNRRIAYNRIFQDKLDYIEIFFDIIEGGQFVYRREPQVSRCIDQAILERDGVRYLAPELVLLFKSKDLSNKNTLDFDATVRSLDSDMKVWLREALAILYGSAHPWLNPLCKQDYV